jgi:preprotein translocase subunit Sec61beta
MKGNRIAPKIIQLLTKELANILGGFRALLLVALLGCFHFLALMFIAPSSVPLFLMLEFSVVPILFLPVAAASIVTDRSSGFASVLLTSPLGHAGYFFSRLSLLFSLGFLVLLGALPFTVIALQPVSAQGLQILAVVFTIGLINLFFAISFGLLVSVLGGRTSPSRAIYVGFAVALVLISIPIVVGSPLTSAVDSTGLHMLVPFFHISPLIPLSDILLLGGVWLPINDGSSLVVLLIGGLIMLLSAFLILTRFQAIEGLGKSRGRQVVTALVAVSLLLAMACILPPRFVIPPKEWSPFTDGGSLHVDFSVDGISLEPPRVGDKLRATVNITLTSFTTPGWLFEDVTVHFRSLFLETNWSDWKIGDVYVESDSPGERVFFHLPLDIRVIGSQSLDFGSASYRVIAVSDDLVGYEIGTLDLETDPPYELEAAIVLTAYILAVGAFAWSRRRNLK